MAMRTGSSTLNYLLGDHLGSQAITTSSSGAMSAEIRYYPWGTERYNSGTTPTTYHFTGQRLESELGLYYYGARWYDPTAGRFIQADSVVPIENSNSENVKRMQLTLIVDYHENNLLIQLNKMYHESLPENIEAVNKQNKGKDLLNSKQTNRNSEYDIHDNHDNEKEKDSEIQTLVYLNGMNDIGKTNTNIRQEDKGKRNEVVDSSYAMPPKIIKTELDRFAYTSNCPTSYTDPSGHCNPLITFLGNGLIRFGGAMFVIGVVGIKTSLEALPVEPDYALSLGAISALTAVGGGLLGYSGEQMLEKNGCIPGVP